MLDKEILKLDCLRAAIGNHRVLENEVIPTAQEYYNFLMGKDSQQKSAEKTYVDLGLCICRKI